MGVAVGRFRLKACRDARGLELPLGDARVALVRTIDGKLVLVDRREGYDSIVVDNSWRQAGEQVFQLALKSASSAPYVREYRLPLAGGPGRFAIVKDVRAWADRGSRFWARYTKAALECELLPEEEGRGT